MPRTFFRIDLVRTRPGGCEEEVDFRIARTHKIRQFLAGDNQLRRIARLVLIKRAVAMRDNDVPRTAADLSLLVLQMEIDSDTTTGFEGDVEFQTRLLGKYLEE